MRRVIAAAALAVLLLPTTATVALAECTDWPIGATERLHIRYAFTATVAASWRDPERSDDGPEFDWRTELDVERTYRGRVPGRIVANGWYFGCHSLRGDRLQTGDRIFVASTAFRPHADGLDPFTVIDGQVIVWKRSGNIWRFFEDGLDYGSDKEFYPRAARTATTTADILALISGRSAPDTSTMSAPGRGDVRAVIPVLALAFIAGFFLGLKRLRAPARWHQ